MSDAEKAPDAASEPVVKEPEPAAAVAATPAPEAKQSASESGAEADKRSRDESGQDDPEANRAKKRGKFDETPSADAAQQQQPAQHPSQQQPPLQHIGFNTSYGGGQPRGASSRVLPHGQISQQIRVPVHVAGNIIGRGGSIIKGLMQQSGAHIQMEQQSEMPRNATDRGVTVTGFPQQVNHALAEIDVIVRERSAGSTPVTPAFMRGPPQHMGHYGAPPPHYPPHHHQQHYPPMHAPPRSSHGGGPPSGAFTLSVPTASVGRLIGTAGSVIKQLIAGSGAHIKFQQKEEMQYGASEREVYISGPEEAIAKAKQMIEEIVANPDGPPAQGGLTSFIHQANTEHKKIIVVPDRKVGSMIGRGGVIIKKLMADSGARIQIQQKADMRGDEREVTITGPGQAIEHATKLIVELLETEGGSSMYSGTSAYGASSSAYSPYAAVSQSTYQPFPGFAAPAAQGASAYGQAPQYAQQPAYAYPQSYAQPQYSQDPHQAPQQYDYSAQQHQYYQQPPQGSYPPAQGSYPPQQ